MGVFDDIKDSVTGSEKENTGGGRSRPEGLKNNDFSTDLGESNNSLTSNQTQSKSSNAEIGSDNRFQNQNTRNSRNGVNSRNSRRTTPNSQAGRPRPGSDQPQLSRNTRKKMENAGLKNTGASRNMENRNVGQERGRSVSESRSDFEELKAQNEQIIELLKRINNSLQRLG